MPFVSKLVEVVRKADADMAAERLVAAGIAQGVAQGRADAVPVMLQLKFGEPGKALAARLAGAGPETWEKVFSAILPAASIEEIEKLVP